ncbi:MAG TPA: 50S ribosomal protein L31e [Nautiliaceae bacterium]|nr:50S ribosomal protein L31e [Nautiliaceae bacterium]
MEKNELNKDSNIKNNEEEKQKETYEVKEKNEEKIEREYIIHYRQKIKTAPKWRRAKKAITYVKEFLKRHMKVKEVKLDNSINEEIWKNGAKNPPGKIKVKVKKENEVAYATLIK